jgi:hypothetical protein
MATSRPGLAVAAGSGGGLGQEAGRKDQLERRVSKGWSSHKVEGDSLSIIMES